jgi:hypothetical protein
VARAENEVSQSQSDDDLKSNREKNVLDTLKMVIALQATPLSKQTTLS